MVLELDLMMYREVIASNSKEILAKGLMKINPNVMKAYKIPPRYAIMAQTS